ncbi:MAG: hypothetical protein DMENIID0002_01760 [Rickettsia endosymbiont of Sergentomyia squamirostris]|uniref:Tetratricopeptide repeat protein n=1 Tax=Candidatus Tisiphia endosymbiont of Sergentomyia squamirostris TaxID=3113639 RepID=A0AAT9G6U5_9RICK
MQEFCSKNTIEKLQYLLDSLNSKNLSKPESIQDNNSSTQEIASTVQQEVVSKETKVDSNDAISNTPTTITEWKELGNAQVESNESEKALQSFNKALEIDPNDQTVLACKVAVLIFPL